jgi:hypothetical protein
MNAHTTIKTNNQQPTTNNQQLIILKKATEATANILKPET